MSKKTISSGVNEFYSISDLPLTGDEKEMVLEYLAHQLLKIRVAIDATDYGGKSYDPLIIDGKIAHTYLFDLEDGGRHHPFRTYDHLQTMMINETIKECKERMKEYV